MTDNAFTISSYGYLGEDGKKYTNAVRGELYAESFSTGDVIGCGIHFAKQEIFFTKNGKYLGIFTFIDNDAYSLSR